MAITALATQNTQVGPAQFADMTNVLTMPFKVDSATDLRPVKSGRLVNIAAGAGTAGGSRIRSTELSAITVDAQSSGGRWDAICIRVDWSTSTCSVVALKGSSTTIPVNQTQAVNTSQVNRIPGVMYDALIAAAYVTSAGITTLYDLRLWGGLGGPYRITDGSIDVVNLLDAPTGSWVCTDKAALTKRLDDDGTWRAVGTVSNPWKTWTPTLRYYGNSSVTGTSGGTIAGNGNNPIVSAKYRVEDGMVDAYVFIQAGSTGATWGDGPMTLDLPLKASATALDTWCVGHLFTTGYGGDGSFDWDAQALIKSGWTRAMLWTHSRIDDCRLVPYICQTPNGGPGSGAPYINGGYPVGTWTFNIKYPTDS